MFSGTNKKRGDHDRLQSRGLAGASADRGHLRQGEESEASFPTRGVVVIFVSPTNLGISAIILGSQLYPWNLLGAV